MKTTERGIENGGGVENVHHMRLMALLKELVEKLGLRQRESTVHRTAALAEECEQTKDGWILSTGCIARDAPSEVVGKRTAFGSNGAVQETEFGGESTNRFWQS